MWGVGCILGELLRHEVLFPASTELGMVQAFCRLLGRPTAAIWPVRRAVSCCKCPTCRCKALLQRESGMCHAAASGPRPGVSLHV